MPRLSVARPLVRAATHVPGLKRVPMAKLFLSAEIALLARDHYTRLDRQQRHRLFELVRIGRGRRRNLSAAERDELASLIATLEPRLFAGHAVNRLSPVPIPRRVLYGPHRRS